jgi:hypothetical protein
VTRETIDAILRIAGLPNQTVPALLTRDMLARELSISPSQLDRLRAQGLPCLRVAGMPRFELAAVLTWLRAKESQPCPENEPENFTPAEADTLRG